jgi:hypothetical protein
VCKGADVSDCAEIKLINRKRLVTRKRGRFEKGERKSGEGETELKIKVILRIEM